MHYALPFYYSYSLILYNIAKEATENVYQPLLIASNLVYVLLLVGWNTTNTQRQWTFWNSIALLVTWGLQAFAYMGILDQAKNSAKANSASNTNKKKDLIGGAHLDLLGLTIVVQYGSVLHSTKWYYLLWAVPIGGGWMLYTTFGGGGKKGTAAAAVATTLDDDDDESAAGASKDKREKRAQKRKQKWG
jgi:hypothetical protein